MRVCTFVLGADLENNLLEWRVIIYISFKGNKIDKNRKPWKSDLLLFRDLLPNLEKVLMVNYSHKITFCSFKFQMMYPHIKSSVDNFFYWTFVMVQLKLHPELVFPIYCCFQ